MSNTAAIVPMRASLTISAARKKRETTQRPQGDDGQARGQ